VHPVRNELPQRRNVFDGDDFDRLNISSKQIHQGRREIQIEESETPDEHSSRKAAILAALSKFDADDDERDDTYDVADVGGTVDQSEDTDKRPRGERALEQSPHEEVLFRAWKDSSALFARDSKTRISPVRQDLKRQTGMSDEQIEGWAIMLNRDAHLQDRLRKRYSTVTSFRGNQPALEAVRWHQSASEDNSANESDGHGEDSSNERGRGGRPFVNRGRGRGGFQGHSTGDSRGRGRGRGGGRANHNRREGRARKMGRGMAGAPVAN
jgi:activating signal cointegrator complex subunit 2